MNQCPTLTKLVEMVEKLSTDEGLNSTLLKDVQLFRQSYTDRQLPVIYKPSIYFIVQGQKDVFWGTKTLTYSESDFLAVSYDIPVIGKVCQASLDRPYLCVQIDIEPSEIYQIAGQIGMQANRKNTQQKMMFVGSADNQLKESILNYLSLLTSPKAERDFLTVHRKQELYYRLLTGEWGEALLGACLTSDNSEKIAKILTSIKQDVSSAHSVEELAKHANMSISSFHSKFKDVTGYSPLQYIKSLKLTQARHLILSNDRRVASAAREVGYESVSQFSREYSRLFGVSPKKDA